MKRYDIEAVDWTESVGLEIAEYELGEWCKADDAIAGMENIAAELAVAQLRIAELEAENKSLKGKNKQQELSIFSLAAKWKERDEALKASQQCITDFLDVYGCGCSMLVLDDAVKSLRDDALRLVRRALIPPTNAI